MFRRPFMLDGLEKMQPAGSYIVDTDEEQVDSNLVNAWRRVATTIRITQPGGAVEYLPVDPGVLKKALAQDGAREGIQVPSDGLGDLPAE